MSKPTLWLVGTATADLLTTMVGITAFGLVESNPFPAMLLNDYGFIAFGLLKAVVIGVVLFQYDWLVDTPYRYSNRLGDISVAVIGCMWAGAALWNVHLMWVGA